MLDCGDDGLGDGFERANLHRAEELREVGRQLRRRPRYLTHRPGDWRRAFGNHGQYRCCARRALQDFERSSPRELVGHVIFCHVSSSRSVKRRPKLRTSL